jgi:hypothetical protein
MNELSIGHPALFDGSVVAWTGQYPSLDYISNAVRLQILLGRGPLMIFPPPREND